MTAFTIETESLVTGINKALSVVPNKPSRDILKCIKIKAEQGKPGKKDQLVISATDLESYIVTNVDQGVIVQTEGQFVVPAQVFADYLKTLEDPQIKILVTPEESLKINEQGTEMEVGLQDIQEFPDFPVIPPNPTTTWVNFSGNAISSALEMVLFAVAEKGHPRWGALSSVCLEFATDKLYIIGTDQHRASVVEVDVPGAVAGNYLAPANAIELLKKIFDADYQMLPNAPNSLIFRDPQSTFFIRLVNGDYPPVKKHIPKHPNKLTLDLIELGKQIKKVALAVDQHNTLKIEIKDDKLCLSTKTRDQRKIAKAEKALNYKGKAIQFALNCKYMLDLIKAANGDEPFEMHFNQSNQTILFTQNKFQHLLVPQEVK